MRGRVLTFSADSQTLVSVGADRTFHYWDVADGKERHRKQLAFAVIEGRFDVVHQVKGVSADGAMHVSSDHEASCRNQGRSIRRKAYRAIWTLAGAPEQAIPFVKDRLKPASDNGKRIARLIVELDSDDITERNAAATELNNLDIEIEPAFHRAIAAGVSLECKRHMEALLDLPSAIVRNREILRGSYRSSSRRNAIRNRGQGLRRESPGRIPSAAVHPHPI